MDKGPLLLENFSNMKSQRVKRDESFVPPLEDEAAEVAHLLAEPKSDHVLVDGVLCFNNQHSGKSSGMEDFSGGLEFGFRTNYGGLDSYITQEGDDLKLEVLDGLLDDVDEVDDFYAATDLFTACEDFLLDIEFAEKVTQLDCGPVEGSSLVNSSSESHSPGLSGNNVAGGISDSSTAQESQCKDDSPDKMLPCELHSAFKSKCECQVPAEGKSRSSDYVNNFDELDNDDNVLLSSILSKCNKRVKSSVTGAKVKRLRKPTQRYVDESSDLKSGYLLRGQNVSHATLKDKHQRVQSHDGSFDESNQAPSESWLQGRLKKCSPMLDFDPNDDIFSSDSDDNRVRKRKSKVDVGRRKHQRMWTLSEVMKLIDGISQFGVGKWTYIKRLLFSSSAHRTPIDLRDKWRNLLRASGAQKKNKVHQKHTMRTLPKSVLCRIRELATIHPYPKVPYLKIPCNGNVVSSKQSNEAEGEPFSGAHGRNVRPWKHLVTESGECCTELGPNFQLPIVKPKDTWPTDV